MHTPRRATWLTCTAMNGGGAARLIAGSLLKAHEMEAASRPRHRSLNFMERSDRWFSSSRNSCRNPPAPTQIFVDLPLGGLRGRLRLDQIVALERAASIQRRSGMSCFKRVLSAAALWLLCSVALEAVAADGPCPEGFQLSPSGQACFAKDLAGADGSFGNLL